VRSVDRTRLLHVAGEATGPDDAVHLALGNTGRRHVAGRIAGSLTASLRSARFRIVLTETVLLPEYTRQLQVYNMNAAHGVTDRSQHPPDGRPGQVAGDRCEPHSGTRAISAGRSPSVETEAD